MKIVDRKTFLEMPVGTLFMKVEACNVGALQMFRGRAGPNDFVYRDLIEVESESSTEFFDIMIAACDTKTRTDIVLDWDLDMSRDGLFDDDQMFGVLDADECEKLLGVLALAPDGFTTPEAEMVADIEEAELHSRQPGANGYRLASLPCKSGEGAGFEALERFITDHEGNDDTNDGIDVERRARAAVSVLRSVVSAALAVCHSGDDDCTNGRVVTIDPDAFDALNAALDIVGDSEAFPDATQTREAELAAALRGIADYPDGNWHGDSEGMRSIARAALNARGDA